jgi:hypothetical protein
LTPESPPKRWHLVAHCVAFYVAAGVGGFFVYPAYPRFVAQTETASEAFGAFLTCIVIAGGVGPAITLYYWSFGYPGWHGAYDLAQPIQDNFDSLQIIH